MRLTIKEARLKIAIRLGVKGDSPVGERSDSLIEPSDMDAAYNDAHRKMCKDFPLSRSSWSTSAVDDERTYAPPPKLSELERVDFNERKLDFVLLEDIFRFGEDVSVTTPTWTEDI